MVRSLKSPSFWVALVALVVAMGGSAVAATLINGKNIRKGSTPGDRLKKKTLKGDRVRSNTLTGTQIAESKLRTVPKAITAGAAADAGQLGGLPPLRFQRYSQDGGRTGNGIAPGYTANGATGCNPGQRCVVSLPGPAPVAVVNVQPGGVGGCTGSVSTPTAPPGVACVYTAGGAGLSGRAMLNGGSRYGFVVTGSGEGTWAYTAPTPPPTG